MRLHTPIPAAQYVRMSTDEQLYSIENQKIAIQTYAEQHGFAVVKTYEDAGKSGLALQHRSGLRSLLRDVTSGCTYQAILVYDISRWGRFQDADEAAHYEFLCRQSGIPIHYCAEPFANDGTLPTSILKALKRTMAAEYSRELSLKVSNGKSRLAALGYWISGRPSFGLRRMLVSAHGRHKQIMQEGEQKSLHSDRAILVPGPPSEVQWVRKIYDLYIGGMGATELAHYLNKKGVHLFSGKWDYSAVLRLLRNPNYIGCSIWGKTSGKLRSRRLRLPKDQWVVKPKAFPAVIDQQTFERVQHLLAVRRVKHAYSDKELIRKVERLLKRYGRLNERIIDKSPGAKSNTYIRHFGGLPEVYTRIGYTPPTRSERVAVGRKRAVGVRESVLERIISLFPHNISTRRVSRKWRDLLFVDGNIWVGVAMCQSYRTRRGRKEWILKPTHAERRFICLLCLLNDANDAVEKFYLLPTLKLVKAGQKYRYLKEEDPILTCGVAVEDLSQLYAAVIRMSAQPTSKHGTVMQNL